MFLKLLLTTLFFQLSVLAQPSLEPTIHDNDTIGVGTGGGERELVAASCSNGRNRPQVCAPVARRQTAFSPLCACPDGLLTPLLLSAASLPALPARRNGEPLLLRAHEGRLQCRGAAQQFRDNHDVFEDAAPPPSPTRRRTHPSKISASEEVAADLAAAMSARR